MGKQLYVVGVDGSDWGKRAFEKATSLASQTGADVTVVYALEYNSGNPLATKGIIPEGLDKEAEENKILEEVINPMLESAPSDVQVDSKVLWGNPVDKIHDLVKSEHANMLFVGRRGRSRFANLILGSVANKLAHHSGVPVVLVP